MSVLLRFNGASARDAAVQQWLAAEPQALRAVARHWFVLMRQCGDTVLELFHDGCPVVCVGDVPFAYVNTYKRHVTVGFYQGANLDDPQRLLLGEGKFMRHVRLGPDVRVDSAALGELITASYQDILARLERGE